MFEEWYEACQTQKEKELENERQGYITEGKKHVKNKDFTLAINNMEKASRIKLDKDVFMYLAHIYKGLNRTRALQTLLNRWQKVNELNEKTHPINEKIVSEKNNAIDEKN